MLNLIPVVYIPRENPPVRREVFAANTLNLSSAKSVLVYLKFSKFKYFDFSCCKRVSIANSLDPNEMLHYVAFRLDPNCLQIFKIITTRSPPW